MGRSKGSRSISSIEYRTLCGSVLLERILRLYPERVEIKKRWAVVTWANYFAQAAARRDFVGFGDDAVIGFLNQESAELTAPGRGPLPSPSRPHEDVLNVFVTRHAIDSCCGLPPPSCSTGKSWLHFRPPPVDFCGSRLAIGAATECARALAMPAGRRAQALQTRANSSGERGLPRAWRVV